MAMTKGVMRNLGKALGRATKGVRVTGGPKMSGGSGSLTKESLTKHYGSTKNRYSC